MEITWLGHSCFLLKDSKGRKLLTDPYDNSIGYPQINESVDVVTVSHQHFDHNYTSELPGTPNIVNECGFFNVCDIPIVGLPSYHDEVKGSKRGDNTIYVVEMDDFRICHLGDLGHHLSADDIGQLGEIDVLLIPVGGNYTIDGKQAAEVARSIKPRIIIPMHYKTPALSFPLNGVEDFITSMKNAEKVENYTLSLDEKPEDYNQVKILKYKMK
jgi:L-ascorbate metabolism protein UlaG (beta-lactamase superfamily)